MSNDQMIHDIITRARTALQKAQTDADDTPRPKDACPAHDSQFALTKAISGALDTLLLMAQQNISSGASEQKQGKLDTLLGIARMPWPWIAFAVASFSPYAIQIINTIKGVTP